MNVVSREIGLARQLLHLIVAQATSVGEHRKLIALQWAAGENIELNKMEFAADVDHSTK